MRIVITGANRGIGLELTRRYLARGDRVDAAVRNPATAKELESLGGSAEGRLRVLACDVSSDESVRALAAALGDAAVDLLINNAGVMGKMQALADLDFADVARTMDTNAFGPLRVTGALLPHLRRGSVRKIVHISSGMGSITDNTSGGAYGYRMSKAALNMGNRSMACDLRGEGFTAIVVNPGWVKTDMGGAGAPTPVEESAQKMLELIDRVGIADTGNFFDYRGHTWQF